MFNINIKLLFLFTLLCLIAGSCDDDSNPMGPDEHIDAEGLILENNEVEIYREFQGAVIAGLNRRKGLIQSNETREDYSTVVADVPLAEMFGYATDLRSMSQGRAVFTMQFSHYSKAPNSVSEQIMEKFQGKAIDSI